MQGLDQKHHRVHLLLQEGLQLRRERSYLSFIDCKSVQLTQLPLSQLEQLCLSVLILYLIIILFHKSV